MQWNLSIQHTVCWEVHLAWVCTVCGLFRACRFLWMNHSPDIVNHRETGSNCYISHCERLQVKMKSFWSVSISIWISDAWFIGQASVLGAHTYCTVPMICIISKKVILPKFSVLFLPCIDFLAFENWYAYLFCCSKQLYG